MFFIIALSREGPGDRGPRLHHPRRRGREHPGLLEKTKGGIANGGYSESARIGKSRKNIGNPYMFNPWVGKP